MACPAATFPLRIRWYKHETPLYILYIALSLGTFYPFSTKTAANWQARQSQIAAKCFRFKFLLFYSIWSSAFLKPLAILVKISSRSFIFQIAMTETTTMADSNERPQNHQSKKKKVDDQAVPPDIGLKPVQLQRRRVWRACESCRCVLQ